MAKVALGMDFSDYFDLPPSVSFPDPDADGRIILRWIFKKWEGVVRTG